MKRTARMNAMCSMTILVLSFLCIGMPLSAETRTASITKEAQNALEQGRYYHDRGDFRRAIPEYDRFIKLVPGRADAYYRRGTAYYNLGDPIQAMENQKIAARLGFKAAQDSLQERETAW